jgi:hypothetical protein
MINWWSKHGGVILCVLVCDIWINVLLQTSALVGPLYIVTLLKFIYLTIFNIQKDYRYFKDESYARSVPFVARIF